VVDSDATFYSYLTDGDIFAEDGRILLTVLKVSPNSPHLFLRWAADAYPDGGYANDKVALQEDSPWECMLASRMPMWFWRSTFQNCRDHIARQWQLPFDEAFKQFSSGPYSHSTSWPTMPFVTKRTSTRCV